MSIIRSSGMITQIKCIFCMMIYLAALVTGMAAKSDVDVQFKITPQLTTESRKIEFEVTNNSLQAISEEIGIVKFEKNIDGQWVEQPFDDAVNLYDAMYKVWFTERNILPHETWHGKISVSALFLDNETPQAGQYRLTFVVSYCNYKTDNGETKRDWKDVYSLCEFTVEQA